ncbi:Eukaryotic translation initiation factor 2D [Allomyces javanicus]|nr:Eukaryotic translation initiation factor 2D [Allomyces javanicus]
MLARTDHDDGGGLQHPLLAAGMDKSSSDSLHVANGALDVKLPSDIKQAKSHQSLYPVPPTLPSSTPSVQLKSTTLSTSTMPVVAENGGTTPATAAIVATPPRFTSSGSVHRSGSMQHPPRVCPASGKRRSFDSVIRFPGTGSGGSGCPMGFTASSAARDSRSAELIAPPPSSPPNAPSTPVRRVSLAASVTSGPVRGLSDPRLEEIINRVSTSIEDVTGSTAAMAAGRVRRITIREEPDGPAPLPSAPGSLGPSKSTLSRPGARLSVGSRPSALRIPTTNSSPGEDKIASIGSPLAASAAASASSAALVPSSLVPSSVSTPVHRRSTTRSVIAAPSSQMDLSWPCRLILWSLCVVSIVVISALVTLQAQQIGSTTSTSRWKAFTVKSSNPVKSSEWRGIRNRLVSQFPLLEPHLSAVAKVINERIQFATEKYVGSLYYATADNELLALDPIEGVFLPSLMLCWRAPDCVPVIMTHDFVMQKICGAADLMAPGIIGDIPPVQPGDIVGISLSRNPRLVLALGVAQMSGEAMARERKGRAVKVIHYVGDTLWEKCGKPRPPADFPAAAIAAVEDEATSKDAVTTETADELSRPRDESADAISDLAQSVEELQVDAEDDAAAIADEPVLDPEPAKSPAAPASPAPAAKPAAVSQDDVAMDAFLRSVPHLDLPISASTLHSKHLKQYAKDLDFKNTKWKKLAKFLKTLDKDEKLITTKDVKGEPHILSVNKTHPRLVEHLEMVAAAAASSSSGKMASKAASAAAGATGSASAQPKSARPASSTDKVTVTPLYQPISSMSFAFPKTAPRYLTRSEVAQYLDAYYDANNLVSTLNRRFITVDMHLDKYAAGDQATAKRDDLLAAVLDKMRKFHCVSTSPDEVRKGEFARVIVSIEKRQGRKMVSVLKNLGALFSLAQLAALQQEFSVKCATSVSVADGHVLVQGDQSKFLLQWAQEKGIAHLVDVVKK